MKKGQIAEGTVERVEYPNKGIVVTDEGERVIVKNTIPGQRVRFGVNKARKGKAEGRLMETIARSPLEADAACSHFGECGGCTYQSLPYEEQLKLKEEQVRRLLDSVVDSYEFFGIKPSPREQEYRNKMEFSFGDAFRDGPLALGMHKRGSFYDIVTVSDCRIVDEDFRRILSATLSYFDRRAVPFYHRMRHTGYLRHLLVRKAARTGEILIDLVTSTQAFISNQAYETESDSRCNDVGFAESGSVSLHKLMTSFDGADSHREGRIETGECAENIKTEESLAREEQELLAGWVNELNRLDLTGTIKGILHTKNDSVADVIKNEGTKVLQGEEFFCEELLGLKFQISPFSFFQTNSLAAEVLYETARELILGGKSEGLHGKVVYDLYSGTGTIAQMLAPVCKEVVGVEIVEEAVEAARENAARNGLDNCSFLAGDVLRVLDTIDKQPDFIVLDPPRDGIHPKALERIIAYGVKQMVYISCKPTSLVRDLEALLESGYVVEKAGCVDMFPGTVHVETCVLLSRKKSGSKSTKIEIEIDLNEADRRECIGKATYQEIKDYVWEHYQTKVSNLYISQIKKKCGLDVGENFNKPKTEGNRVPNCPIEKERMIRKALEYFGMIDKE